KDEKKAFLCYFGDGATSEGDFHEGLNFAGVFDTPNIFFCNNNQYAISVPREKQTASKTISQKANAYGFKGVQVDGMDPLAVYKTTKEAVDKAKNPKKDELRPTLIEAVQYRFNAHTTADDPSKYRDEKEVEKWREKDPLKRLRKFLTRTGRLDTETDDVIQTKVEEKVSQAVEEAESFEPDVESMFRNVYDEMTPELRRQLENLNSLRERIGDETFRQDRS
ncbi:MAG: thiamine pyrophosphate-dependent enzyme, partial [Halobacteria archaeon]|nr:thiamine pyrophosphate-dependent enzyme [Halobacteria archaeon]